MTLTYLILSLAIAAIWMLVRIALGMCRVSGHFSEQEEIDEAKRKWGSTCRKLSAK